MQGHAVAIGAMGVGTPRITLITILEFKRSLSGEARSHHEYFACGCISGYQHEVILHPFVSLGRG